MLILFVTLVTELSRKFTKAILGEFHERIHQVKMLVNSPLRTFAKVINLQATRQGHLLDSASASAVVGVAMPVTGRTCASSLAPCTSCRN